MEEPIVDDKAMKSDVEALRADFKQVKEDLVELTKTLTQLTSRQASESIDDLKERRDRLEAQLRSAATEARDTLEQRVKDQPLGTLLIAFGIGLLIGKSAGR